jgi:hypothetical protein
MEFTKEGKRRACSSTSSQLQAGDMVIDLPDEASLRPVRPLNGLSRPCLPEMIRWLPVGAHTQQRARSSFSRDPRAQVRDRST